MESDDPDADTASIMPQIVLIVVLTAINAFFAAAELAVVSANKNKIKRLASEGNKKARNVEKLASDETKFLSTIQVGITLAGFFSSATASVTLSEGFGRWLESVGISFGSEISMVIITLLLSYITLIFGELLPKRVALRDPERTSMKYAGALLVIKWFATPFVKLLSGSCNLLAKMLHIDKNIEEEKVSDDDIIDVVTEGVSDGSVEEDKQKIIESTLKFYHLSATELMTPRVDVFMIDIDDDQAENIEKMLGEKFTRVPVYKDSVDNIIGIINVKDILTAAHKDGFENVDLEKIMREPYFTREFVEADELFKKMKAENQQMAFLVDEFGGFSGLVTMEDLVEEIVGNINDEFDDEVDIVNEGGDEDVFTVSGTVAVHELNAELDIELDDENEKFDTIAGLIIDVIGHIPQKDEEIDIIVDNVRLQVTELENNRIVTVVVTKLPPVEESDEDEDEEEQKPERSDKKDKKDRKEKDDD